MKPISDHIKSTNEQLGYPPDVRLLIINADDFGMCHAINDATLRTIRHGLATSCTIMLPCPWSLHALHLLRDNPDIPFGVHLTVISEMPWVRWGPVTARQEVPSLIDEAGQFYSEERIPEFLQQVNVGELEKEFRAQIEAVLATDLRPTHVDSHCLIHTRREDIFDMTVKLAREYRLALRVGVEAFSEKLQRQGYATDDHKTLDSYRLGTSGKAVQYSRLLRGLPAGLSEWAIHPGIGNAELQALTPDWGVRQADFDFFTAPVARDIVNEEGIVLLSYEPLQALWRTIQS